MIGRVIRDVIEFIVNKRLMKAGTRLALRTTRARIHLRLIPGKTGY